MRFTPDDPRYPSRLHELPDPPAITVTRPLEARGPVVAIVGSRLPLEGSRAFAFALAHDLARVGATIVSGGAVGIDAAAHEGALAASGATWVVLPCSEEFVSPPENAALFDRVRDSAGALVWPFPRGTIKDDVTPRARNGVLTALADAVVVVQARLKSGSRNAANWARSHERPLWVVPAAPWMEPFSGSIDELAKGARALWTTADLFVALGLTVKEGARRPTFHTLQNQAQPKGSRRNHTPPRKRPRDTSWSSEEKRIFSKLSILPTHVDQVTRQTGLQVGAVLTGLLTLSVKNVVVEGPDGFFRLRSEG